MMASMKVFGITDKGNPNSRASKVALDVVNVLFRPHCFENNKRQPIERSVSQERFRNRVLLHNRRGRRINQFYEGHPQA